jgi:hypothetical protein
MLQLTNSMLALRKLRLLASSILGAMLLFMLPVVMHAQQTENARVISYQGSVMTNSGSPVNGDHLITTTLYSDANGTQAVWSGTYKQQITGSIFTVLLGSGAYPLPVGQDFSKSLWIGVKIDGGEELKPLTQYTGAQFNSIADKSVSKDKIAFDYVGSIMVNGKRITGKGTTLNLVDGENTSLLYEEGTNSLSLNLIGGSHVHTPQVAVGPWTTAGQAILPAPGINQTFGSTDAADVIMIAKNIEQMRMLGQQALGSTGTSGIIFPASNANGTGIIFQGAVATPKLYIHSFGGVTNFFAGNDAGNLSMNITTFPAINNTGVGNEALKSLSIGYGNTASGFKALKSNTTGYKNTANGAYSLYSNTDGTENTATGYEALYNNTTGSLNSAYGYRALYYNSGNYNAAFGHRALVVNDVGTENTACGYDAMLDNTDGSYNTACGAEALATNLTGSYNTASGFQALNHSTSDENTSVGYLSLSNTSSGGANTALGFRAGIAITTGSNNTFIGNVTNATANNLTNASAIGNGASVTASNTIELGNASVTAVSTYGHIVTQSLIGSVAGDGAVITTASISATGSDVAGNVTFSTSGTAGNGTATITFATTYGAAPTVVLFPANAAATSVNLSAIFVTSTATTFTINVTGSTTAVTDATFNYIVIH